MTAPSSLRFPLLVALLAAVFVAGVAVGVIGDRLAGKARPEVRTRIKIGGDMASVLDRLELSPQQRARADSIVSHRTPRSEGLMMEMAERLKAVSDSIDAELRQILTPAQRVRLDSLRTREPQFRLKRRMVTPEGTVDTVITLPRDSAKRKPSP